MFGWLKRRRRERLRAQPFPDEWDAILRRNVRYYRHLPDDDRVELQGHVQVLLAEKNFEGCGGLEMTDEIRVTIAGQAAILLLHRDTVYFPRLVSILVYPGAFIAPTEEDELGDEIIEGEDIHLGESWSIGALVLSWNHVLHGGRNARDGENVVLHEFAHQLDDEDGVSNGAPLLDSGHEEWGRVLSGEFENLWSDIERNQRTLINTYGATNPAEFFAVVTECFFEQPEAMRRKHPELYAVLSDFYRQDPEKILERTPL
jgi:hypothetical protein